jgi:hypothetical protein
LRIENRQLKSGGSHRADRDLNRAFLGDEPVIAAIIARSGNMFKTEVHVRCWRLLLIVAGLVASSTIVLGQQPTSPSPKPTSPGEIAKVSRALTQKSENCRLQAKEAKLTGFKRRRFIRDCIKK